MGRSHFPTSVMVRAFGARTLGRHTCRISSQWITSCGPSEKILDYAIRYTTVDAFRTALACALNEIAVETCSIIDANFA
ncbi:hypothetical protein KIN20_034248 [Parelaphostrongylus tenuis]|uniref:Uncharacterized protein n=1 Tax=Parelaphostrongylus tenuis TaxID=148309 RepID=A0AAD5RC37_PARTN|nr:hypothetical protein KIN20_034248 [Parelaphostrongylus tenuis]